MINQHFETYQRRDVRCLGNFVYVAAAPGVVKITDAYGQYDITRGAQIKSDTLRGQISVENRGAPGVIELISGNGEYVPPQAEQVSISELPEVVVSELPEVVVSELPEVVVSGLPEVVVSGLPPVVVKHADMPINVIAGEVPQSVAQNSERRAVMVRAGIDNAAPVQLNGFDILAGELLVIESAQAINITGTAGDTVQIMEY